MKQNATIVGAGIAGMCTALALAHRGYSVTLFERDIPPPDGDADQAFFEWQRRGAAQFKHPHAFLGLMCSLLEAHYPELLAAFFDAGARRLNFADMVPPHMLADYVPEPGDEKLWMLLCRRATIESVLRNHVSQQDKISIHDTTYVTGLITETQQDGSIVARGLNLTDRSNQNTKSVHHTDLIIDASGRASKFPRWLSDVGVNIPEQRNDAEIVYYTRHYRLLPGVEEPSRHGEDPSAGDLGYMKYGVFPGDNGHFALIICLPNGEQELRGAVKDGKNFDAICRTVPGLLPWIADDKAVATTPSFGIGDIHAVWRDYAPGNEPKIHNFFAVGDASIRTNPLYGRGCSTGILHAHILAEVLEDTHHPNERAKAFQKRTNERIRPIFDASLSEDKKGIRQAAALMAGEPLHRANTWKKWFSLAFADALAAAIKYDIHVFRGMMRTVNLVEPPGAFLSEKAIKQTVFRYMLRGRRRNAKARIQRGLTRLELIRHVNALTQQPKSETSQV